ncbi:unnamed protein product [Aureobasidium mustum]|uniref:Uncharacterized protein n=1 Tax=Aureobasidium mustum TaxID=2773714 RepID=A0A9N8P9Y4_9PEZI|nr:unnamed protein product [Aureobasidium mustum]
MHHASKHIQANVGKLEQDLEHFAEQRLQVSAKLQKWFAIHHRDGTWDIKNPCLKCLLLFNKIDQLYFAACADIRDMMTVLEKGLRASALLYKVMNKGQTQAQTLGEFCAPLLRNLESAECMLQALEDDAEKRKGWPQVLSSEQYSATASQPENDENQNHSEGDNAKTEVITDSTAITVSRVNWAFGDEVHVLERFQHMAGLKDGEVKFAIHPNGDLSAQQWFQSGGQWFNIGHHSRSLMRIEGSLASHRLREEVELRVHGLPQNSLGYFKAVARQHEAFTMKLPFGLEELQACLTNGSVNRAGQEMANTSSAIETATRLEAEPGNAETADEDNTDDAKSKQVKSKRASRRNRRRRRVDGEGVASRRPGSWPTYPSEDTGLSQ